MNATAGSGALTVQFGSGQATVTNTNPSSAADVFRFIAGSGGGTDLIVGYRSGTDSVQFSGVSITSQGITTTGLNARLNLVLSDNTHATLAGASHL